MSIEGSREPELPEVKQEGQETFAEANQIDSAKFLKISLEKLRSLEIIIEKLEQEKQKIEDRTTQEGDEQNEKDVRLKSINDTLAQYKYERDIIKGIFELASPQAETGEVGS